MLMRNEQWLTRICALLLIGGLFLAPIKALASGSLIASADKQIASKKYKAAARTLTKAMNSGDLSDSEMAQALYRRGTAYNGVGRHSSAIADLTGALWLGKLSATAQKDAYRQRATAYSATGNKKLARNDLGKAGTSNVKTANKPARTKTTAGPKPPIPTFNTVVRAAKKARPRKTTKVVAKPVAPQKSAIPAFRTSIATE